MKNRLSIFTIIGLIAGILFGLFFKESVPSVEFLGTWYVKILKYFITPVIFTSIAATIYETSKKKSRMVIKSVVTFIIMFVATFFITSVMVVLVNPGRGFTFDPTEWTGSTTEFNFWQMIVNLFPKTWKEVFVNPKVFAIILFAYVFGKLGSLFNADKVFGFIGKVRDFLLKILGWYMYVTPIAVFSLMAVTVSKYGYILLGVGLKYIACAWICGLVTLVLVMILPVSAIAKVKPKEYIKKASKVWLMTLTTCSSAATLPYTVKVCNEDFGIPKDVTDVVVPLGCTIHMCGGAVSFALLGFFCAGLYGVEISFATFVMMVVSALLINMAAPGIPNGGIVIGATYLQMMGIPLGFIGFYSGIYKFLDMAYTTLNVTGDISANIILSKLNKHR